jgi:hypothetical protein
MNIGFYRGSIFIHRYSRRMYKCDPKIETCSGAIQAGGGMPLSFMSRDYTEPQGPAGNTMLVSQAMLARPSINMTGGSRKRHRGGFSPSVMGSFVQNGAMLLPAAGITGYRMLKNYKNPARSRRGKQKKRRKHTLRK